MQLVPVKHDHIGNHREHLLGGGHGPGDRRGLFSRTVGVEVPLQVVGPGKAPVADLAPEGALSGVLPHVRLQVVFQVKPAPADVTHKGSLLGVCLDVTFQFGSRLEGEVATGTLKLLFWVGPLVVLQALSVREAYFALSAAVVGQRV